MSENISHLVERVLKIEERLGLELKSIYVELDDGYLKCNGEVRVINGDSVDFDFEIVIAVYDDEERVVKVEDVSFYEKDFYEFDIFKFNIWGVEEKVSKIRVFPRKT